MSSSIPRPLPAGSVKLRRRRYVAWIGETIEPGRARMIAEGRFASFDDAKAWADGAHGDAELAEVTSYAEERFWRPLDIAHRTAGAWFHGGRSRGDAEPFEEASR